MVLLSARIDLGDIILLSYRAVYFKSCKALVFGDLHLGLEYYYAERGMYIPPLQYKEMKAMIERAIYETKPKKIIILGDLKHTFERKTPQEHREVLSLLDFFHDLGTETCLIRGNHDTFIRGLLESKGISFEDSMRCGKYIFVHGHKVYPSMNELKNVFVVYAHVHPTITLSDGISRVRIPVFLIAEKSLVLPSMTPLLPGFDIFRGILDQEFVSPLLGRMSEYIIYGIFGKTVRKLGRINGARVAPERYYRKLIDQF